MIRISIYPSITSDGIGTYVNGIKDLVCADAVPAYSGLFSLRTFLYAPKNYDIIHSPTTLVPLISHGAKVVCTIQDVIPLSPLSGLNPVARFYFRARIWWSIRKSDYLIFTSRNTLEDVIRKFGPIGPHAVIPLAVDEPLSGNFRSPYSFPYCFSLGRRRRHKNIMGIIDAFALVQRSHGLHLVFGGKEDIHDESIRLRARELGIEDRIVFAGFLSGAQLAAHYINASSLVFASLYEGFGLPILEAMSYGCPVITSNRASMPEVAGGAALLVNPEDIESIANSIQSLHTDSLLRLKLIELGLNNAKLYSWSRVASETYNVYKKVVVNR